MWAGIALILCGLASFAVDRRAAHFFHAAIGRRFERVLHAGTDWAKGAFWLWAALLALLVSWLWQRWFGASPEAARLMVVSEAFLASLAVASVILHTIKILLGRRRPRDELELALYGFRPFTFDLRSDSFPSGHALTICCVAVIMATALPAFAILWFAIAAYLALTRALLNSHFVSDVFVGAGIALIVSRETVIYLFPALARPWF